MIENYISKEESKNVFTHNNKEIALREYQEDLVFYWSGEEEQAEYAIVDSSPEFTKAPTICQDGKFGSYSKLSSPIYFDNRNFESITNNLSLSFYLGVNSINGYFSSTFTKKNNDIIPAGDYSLVIQPDNEISQTLILNFKKDSTFEEFKNKLEFVLDPKKYNVKVLKFSDNSFTIASSVKGKKVKFSDGNDGTSILKLFDITDNNFGTYPSKDITVLSLKGASSSLEINHIKLDGKSKLRFTLKQGDIDKTTTIDWNNDGVSLDNIEVDIDMSVMYIFLNGELLKAVLISPIKKSQEKMLLTLNGTDEDIYSFEEIIIKNKLQNKESFTPSNSQLTKYDTTIPFIDFYFLSNNISKENIKELNIDSSENISILLNYDGLYYYYSAGSWRSSDGSFIESNNKYEFQDNIKSFEFIKDKQLFLRVFFESNGTDPSWIKNLFFELSDEDILGDGRLTPAILIGENQYNKKPSTLVDDIKGQTFKDEQESVYTFNKDATSVSMTYSAGTAIFNTSFNETDKTITLTPVDYIYSKEPNTYACVKTDTGYILSGEPTEGYPDTIILNRTSEPKKPIELKGKTLIIKTDKGNSEILFEDNLFIDEAAEYIKSKYPEGIAEVKVDSLGRLVLISETKGPEAFIQTYGDAGFLLFGKENSAQGEDNGEDELENAYNDFLDKMKDYLNSELIPIEISDKSMRLYLEEALNIYKKYRSNDISIYSAKLKGSASEGYEIPSFIDDKDIVDIVFKPLFPIEFYTGGFDNDMDDVITLSLINLLSGKGGTNYGNSYGGVGFTTDYYVSLMNIQDFKNATGLNPQWHVYRKDGEKRLFIFPNGISRYTEVIIKYKSEINVIDAMKRDDFFQKYIAGTIMVHQGSIRSQFSGNLSAGQNIALTMNGDSLYERGKAMKDEALETLKKEQGPLGFYFF